MKPPRGNSRSTQCLEIVLLESPILLHGSPAECVGCILRGSIRLNLAEPSELRNVVLHFKGIFSIARKSHSTKKHKKAASTAKGCRHQIIYERGWSIFPPGSHVLNAGLHLFPFELALPGNLPESLLVDCGSIVYVLKAVVERPGLLRNYSTKMTVPLHRMSMSFNPYDIDMPLTINDLWEGKLDYTVHFESSVCMSGYPVDVAFKLRPLSEKIVLDRIVISVKEYVTCNPNISGSLPLVNSKRICSEIYSNLPLINRLVDATLSILIPKAPHIQTDVTNGIVKVRHRLKVKMVLKDSECRLSQITKVFATFPLIVRHPTATHHSLELPTYCESAIDNIYPLCNRDPPPQYSESSFDANLQESNV